MIETHIKPGKAPRVLAVFSFRYDAHLVPALCQNLEPIVDGWVSYDDRGSAEMFSSELHRRMALLEAARDAGAQWALGIDPDERLEARLADGISDLIERPGARAYIFALRDLYTPDSYRVDGVWGRKGQTRLISLAHGFVSHADELHQPWANCIPDPDPQESGFNLYHLKMIDPRRRQGRADLYKRLDPTGRMQARGYDYLTNEEGAQLERIPAGRDYFPPHVDDGGLWMPPVT